MNDLIGIIGMTLIMTSIVLVRNIRRFLALQITASVVLFMYAMSIGSSIFMCLNAFMFIVATTRYLIGGNLNDNCS